MIKSLAVVSIAVLSFILFAGGPPNPGTGPDMRKEENKKKYGNVANRDKTAPKGKLNPNKPQPPKKG